MLEIYCDYCHEELTKPGAILLSPPDSEGRVVKIHICVACYGSIPAPTPRGKP